MQELIKTRFGKSASHYDSHARVQKEIVRTLFTLIRQYGFAQEPGGPDILEFGCGTGNLSRLLQTLRPSRFLLNDLCPAYENLLREKLETPDGPHPKEKGRPYGIFLRTDKTGENRKEPENHPENIRPAFPEFRWGDIRQIVRELSEEKARFRLIASSSALQWIERPDSFLLECHRLLCPGGLLAVSTFAPGNLYQTAHLTGYSLPYLSGTEFTETLKKYYRILYTGQEEKKLLFPDPVSVLRHLKATGVNGLHSAFWTRGRLKDFTETYRSRFSDKNGRCLLTYRPLYLICRPL